MRRLVMCVIIIGMKIRGLGKDRVKIEVRL